MWIVKGTFRGTTLLFGHKSTFESLILFANLPLSFSADIINTCDVFPTPLVMLAFFYL